MTSERTAQPLRILVVKAHPHDFTHCAGTCGVHSSTGDAVTLVCVTDGILTHNERLHDELLKPEEDRDPVVINQTAQEYAEIKASEIREVCALFEVTDVRFLGFPQPFRLERTPEVVEKLRDIIYDVRPHVMITQSPFLKGHHGMAPTHRDDHTETAIAVHEAMGLAATATHSAKERPHTIAAIYYPGVYFMDDEMDFYVDISGWHEQRIQAEILFSSQAQTEALARKRVEIAAGHMGWVSGTEYAEGFVRAKPELLPRITVAESSLKRAEEPRIKHLKRMSGELK